jgi:hypothetical protein
MPHFRQESRSAFANFAAQLIPRFRGKQKGDGRADQGTDNDTYQKSNCLSHEILLESF